MSRSHTKYGKAMYSLSKHGESKDNKKLANRYVRRKFNRDLDGFKLKGCFYKKLIPWWQIVGDFRKPYTLSQHLSYEESYAKQYNEVFDKEKAILLWKKACYFK